MSVVVVGLIEIHLNETCSEVCISKHLSDAFPVQNGLKQGDVLLPLLLNFATMNVQEIQEH
jgi:hypothetical protein